MRGRPNFNPLICNRGFIAILVLLASCVTSRESGTRLVPLPVPSVNEESFKIKWGASGHYTKPDLGPYYSYNRVPLSRQLGLLRSAGFSWYRNGCNEHTCPTLLSEANKAGIHILGGFALWPDEKSDEASNYQRVYDYTSKFARRYPQIQYYEAGNEVDNWVGMTGDGSTRDQYNNARFAQARGFIKGFVDGIHAGNPNAVVMVGDAGYCHYGFLESLWNDGIRWDITAFHWYATMGNIEKAGCHEANAAAIHASFGLPVWITELNDDAAAKNDDQTAAAMWLVAFANQIKTVASKYDIRAVFVYELLDEPNWQDMQGHFGIADGVGNPKAAYQSLRTMLIKR